MSPEEFDSLINNLKKLPGEFKALVEKRIELFALEMGERISGLIAHVMYRLTGILFLSVGLILILFAASKLVGELLGNEGLGFILVALPIIIIGIMFFLRRPRSMVRATRDKMLQQFMTDMEEQLSQLEDNEQDGRDTREERSSGHQAGRESQKQNE